VIISIVENTGAGAATNNGWISGGSTALAKEMVEILRLYLIFHHTRTTELHGLNMSLSRNSDGFTHGFDLLCAFDEAHFMKQMIKRNKFPWRSFARTGSLSNLINPT